MTDATPDPEEETKKAAARTISVKEGCTYSVMDGFALRNVTPYALALGASNAHIGFLSSIPSLIGNIGQLWTSKAMERYPRKRIVITGVLLQALMWLPLLGVGALYFIFHITNTWIPIAIIAIYTLLILFGAFIGPVWMSWMNDLVRTNAGAYYGRRNRITGIVALVAALIGGLVLDYFKQYNLLIGFVVLFGIAWIVRSFGGYLFTKQYEPRFKHEEGYFFSIKDFVKRMRHNNFGRFAIFDAAMSFAVAIGSPFCAVYMLSNLHFGYFTYTLVTFGGATAQLLFMPAWGKFADRYGNMKVMRMTGLLVPLVMFLWALAGVVNNYAPLLIVPFLMLTDFFSGFSWAGFNLSTTNFLYDAVTRQRLSLCAAYTNILNGLGTFLGAILGGFLATMHAGPLGINAVIFVFIISGIGRYVAAIWMRKKVQEVKPVQPFTHKEAREKILALSPRQVLSILDLKQ